MIVQSRRELTRRVAGVSKINTAYRGQKGPIFSKFVPVVDGPNRCWMHPASVAETERARAELSRELTGTKELLTDAKIGERVGYHRVLDRRYGPVTPERANAASLDLGLTKRQTRIFERSCAMFLRSTSPRTSTWPSVATARASSSSRRGWRWRSRGAVCGMWRVSAPASSWHSASGGRSSAGSSASATRPHSTRLAGATGSRSWT